MREIMYSVEPWYCHVLGENVPIAVLCNNAEEKRICLKQTLCDKCLNRYISKKIQKTLSTPVH